MKYTSTRDATKFYTFEEALFSGYAPDGGLFVPAKLPAVMMQQLPRLLKEEWPKLDYADLATEVLYPFLGCDGDDDGGEGISNSISKTDLSILLKRALTGFDVPCDEEMFDNLVPIIPMIRRNGTSNSDNHVDCYVAELFHGPTYCFKDLGMRATVFLLEYFARKSNMSSSNSSSNDCMNQTSTKTTATTTTAATAATPKKVVLTAATTGDTGPAAVRAVQDLDSPHLGIVVHYPEGQISNFQRKQMTTIQFSSSSSSKNKRVEIVSFQGGGDDMDRPIKNIMTHKQQQHQQNNESSSEKSERTVSTNSTASDDNILVCGVNSYNIGRPLMQMVHFVWTYLRVVEHIETATEQKIDPDTFRLDVIIPTGAMGNIAGCYMAKKLGVPFGNLCAGVNSNDVTHRAFSNGIVRKPRSGEPMKPSLSDAINIQLPYNLERLLFYLTDQNHTLVKTWYDQLEENSNTTTATDDAVIDLTATTVDNSSISWLTKLQTEFRSAKVTDDILCDTIQRVLDTYGYWIDPHTGVAFGAAEQLGYLSSSLPSSLEKKGCRNNHHRPFVIMATASPCKFEAAMTKAVGKAKWKDYEDHHFPARGKDLKNKKETPPTRYLADPNKSLEENQLDWEANTRALIAKLGR